MCCTGIAVRSGLSTAAACSEWHNTPPPMTLSVKVAYESHILKTPWLKSVMISQDLHPACGACHAESLNLLSRRHNAARLVMVHWQWRMQTLRLLNFARLTGTRADTHPAGFMHPVMVPQITVEASCGHVGKLLPR